MNFISSFISSFISFCVLFLLGILLLGGAWNIIDLNFLMRQFLDYVNQDIYTRIVIALIGFLLVLICLRKIQKIFAGTPNKEKVITFEGATGPISITVNSVSEVVKKILEDEDVIFNRSKITVSKKGIKAVIEISLALQNNIPLYLRNIQVKIKEGLHNILGEEKDILLTVKVKKLISKKVKKTENNEEEEGNKLEDVPFRTY